MTGVDEWNDDGRTTGAVGGAGNQGVDRDDYEEGGGDWEGRGNWDLRGKKGEEEEGRREEEEEEERCTWIDPVDGKEIEVNPWRRSDLVERPLLMVVLGCGFVFYGATPAIVARSVFDELRYNFGRSSIPILWMKKCRLKLRCFGVYSHLSPFTFHLSHMELLHVIFLLRYFLSFTYGTTTVFCC